MVKDPTVYPEIKGHLHLRRILCFYEATLRMEKVENRYPRDHVHWSNMETKEIKREGLFYFAVGKFLKENLAAACKFTVQSTMAQIAKS
ncbi:hypothetical protein FACUT_14053 [Fusarium acutatum]|uniref:Uncharacterized protein n=1 Tax=Fusarium acutatum TaxID=78861 RepID=A0A8H4JA86_9HYPO|nr:hypothetical protein FACUT_14053 [Fusarium acutatum]